MSDRPEFTVVCAGGCGRTTKTNKPTVLWAENFCPECESDREDQS